MSFSVGDICPFAPLIENCTCCRPNILRYLAALQGPVKIKSDIAWGRPLRRLTQNCTFGRLKSTPPKQTYHQEISHRVGVGCEFLAEEKLHIQWLTWATEARATRRRSGKHVPLGDWLFPPRLFISHRFGSRPDHPNGGVILRLEPEAETLLIYGKEAVRDRYSICTSPHEETARLSSQKGGCIMQPRARIAHVVRTRPTQAIIDFLSGESGTLLQLLTFVRGIRRTLRRSLLHARIDYYSTSS
jgi:hypothetical protein